MDGVVIDVKVFSRRERDERGKKEERRKVDRIKREEKKRVKNVVGSRNERVISILEGMSTRRVNDPVSSAMLIRSGRKINAQLFEDLDLEDVSTFIASGNVIFSVDSDDMAALRVDIESHLEGELGYEVATFLGFYPDIADG